MAFNFKTKIHCIYDESRPVYFSSAGSPEVDLYDSKYDDDGHLIVFKSGKSNLQDYIDSFRESCDINVLVERFQRGEILDFNFVEGAYLDSTKFPKTYAEMVNFVKEGEETFNNLPSEVKEQFNNNPVEFYMSIGTPEYVQKLEKFRPPVRPAVTEKEVLINESKSDE